MALARPHVRQAATLSRHQDWHWELTVTAMLLALLKQVMPRQRQRGRQRHEPHHTFTAFEAETKTERDAQAGPTVHDMRL